MKLLKLFILFNLAIFCISCQSTGFVIPDSNLSLIDTRRIFVLALGQVRTVSVNGREVLSYYHDPKFKKISNPNDVPERFYTKLIILGTRRPYDIDVQVHQQIKVGDGDQYEESGLDEDLSELRGEQIKKVLNQSRARSLKVDGEDPF